MVNEVSGKEWFERRGELKKAFEGANDRKDRTEEGSKQVKEDQPPVRPPPPPGPGSRAVDRQAHQQRMRRDDQAARSRGQPQGAKPDEQARKESYAAQRRRLRDTFKSAAKDKPKVK